MGDSVENSAHFSSNMSKCQRKANNSPFTLTLELGLALCERLELELSVAADAAEALQARAGAGLAAALQPASARHLVVVAAVAEVV